MLMAFNDNSSDRKLFFQALSAVLEITIERLDINDYRDSLIIMFGENLFEIVTKSLSCEVNFYGLTPTNMNLENQEKHQKLIASYLKLQKARKSFLEKSVNQ